ncbi:hypothetical protein [Polaribacter porphyrae]|uniref:Uncharacterized protein n=1 Tax=Polaribacter porphyrae TaxID=1137780 RepID=A0A2S7WM30_9FLAO|nr:hypothetical protein [Polaribacter porphyrae]PQJ78629.1 hypothetical protein BTO18_05250 [Polaribacter porphyrae]
MKQLIFLFFLFANVFNSNAQDNLTKRFNGKYHLLEAEKGIDNKPSKIKFVEFGENNGKKLLAVAACEKCTPAIFSYKQEESKKYGTPIFFNYFGLYAITYDKESFIIVFVDKKLGSGTWTKFGFSNFYSKSKTKVAQMTKEKLEAFAIALSKK